RALRFGLVLEGVVDGNVGVDFDGLAIEISWAIAPLADGVQSGLDKERTATNNLQGLDGAVDGDDGAQLDVAGLMGLDGEGRIDWLDPMDKNGSNDGLGDAPWFRASRRFFMRTLGL